MKEQTNREIIKVIKSNRGRLTLQQYRTLKGQCIAGDADGALKGLHTILERKETE